MDETTIETEPSPVLTPDTENATYFDPSEVNESTSVNYRRLRLYNRNTWHDRREENKPVTRRRDNLAILDALSGQLDLTDYQKDKARRTFDQLHIKDIGEPVQLIAFCVCTVVANEDVPDGYRFYPQMNDPDELFVEIADNLDFTVSQLHRVISLVSGERHNA